MREQRLGFMLIVFLSFQTGVASASDINIGKMMRVAATHAQCAFLASVAAESQSHYEDKIMTHMSAFLDI